MNKPRLSFFARTLIGFVCWTGLIIQLYLLIHNSAVNGLTPLQAVGRFFGYFTILSNLFIALSCTITILFPVTTAGRFFNKPAIVAALALYIFIVGLVYNTVLRSLWKPKGLQEIADNILHVIVPVLYVLFWIICTTKRTLNWKHPFIWLLYPFFYLLYAITRGLASGFYAYPFIDLSKSSAGKVAFNILLLMLVFIFIGFLFVLADKKLKAAKIVA